MESVEVSSVTLYASDRLQVADGWNAHTHKGLGTAHDMLKSMINMETGARGFIVAGADAFLAPGNEGLTTHGAIWAEARPLTSDNPARQERLDKMQARHLEFVAVVTAMRPMRREVKAGSRTCEPIKPAAAPVAERVSAAPATAPAALPIGKPSDRPAVGRPSWGSMARPASRPATAGLNRADRAVPLPGTV